MNTLLLNGYVVGESPEMYALTSLSEARYIYVYIYVYIYIFINNFDINIYIWITLISLYPPFNEVGGGGYIGFTLSLCPSIQLSVCPSFPL